MKLFFEKTEDAAVFMGQFYGIMMSKGYITISDICKLAPEKPACIQYACENVSYAINSNIVEEVYKYTGYILNKGIPEMYFKFRDDIQKWMIKVVPDPYLVIPNRLEVTNHA
jgi:hypothetical protein